ncbi:MFS transporter [Streptomyces celluloflavus]|uniref:MFS transporter n=1 Tax=Streptomyces celluloflavus TaxID=58344 RepID=UPI0034610351|nr:MFS transporter [Streptomyces celluloflavus]
MPLRHGGNQRFGYPVAAVVFAIGMAGTTLPTPLYGLYRERLGFSELMVTVVFAAYAVGVITVLLLAGNLSDVVGRRPVLLCALGLSAASALCFLFEGGVPMLLVGRVLSGFAAGLFSGTATATVLELAKPGQEARAGFAATAANMGGLGCGPLLAGLLAQYTPWPLSLPFLVHLALLAVAGVLTWLVPETVRTARTTRTARAVRTDGTTGQGQRPVRSARRRPAALRMPPEVRGVFAPSAIAAFAGFALLGLFTAVAPSFVGQTLGVRNLAVSGAVVFTVFLGSTAGQSLTGRLGITRALPGGCLVLVAGLLLVGASLVVESLPLLVIGAVLGGTGQGLAFRAALTAVSAAAPPEHRGGTISAFFVIAYLGISLPVVGVGALTLWLGLRGAGLTFAGCVIVLAACVGRYVVRRPPTER